MARFERSRESTGRDSRDSPNRGGRSRSSFSDGPRDGGRGRSSYGGSSSRDGGRSRSSYGDGPRDNNRRFSGSDRREVQMTKVTCSDCGTKCEVPFKPTSSKPVFCNDCFAKKENSGSGGRSSKDFDMINEKLDKIMSFLKIK